MAELVMRKPRRIAREVASAFLGWGAALLLTAAFLVSVVGFGADKLFSAAFYLLGVANGLALAPLKRRRQKQIAKRAYPVLLRLRPAFRRLYFGSRPR